MDRSERLKVVEVSNLRFTYRGNVEVLKGISLEVLAGERVIIVGPNGSGKTTLLKVLLGLLPRYEGRVSVWGHEPSRLPPRLRRKVSYVPEEALLPGNMHVSSYIEEISTLKGCDPSSTSLYLKALGLEKYLGKRLDNLSQGYKKRVMMAAALACYPELIILDEPYSNIDIETRIIIDDMIKGLPRESTLIMSTHIPPKLEGSTLIVLLEGQIAVTSKYDLHAIQFTVTCNNKIVKVKSLTEACRKLQEGCHIGKVECLSPIDEAFKKALETMR